MAKTDETDSTDQALRADRMLAAQAAAGDRQAFQRIVDSNKQRMYSVAMSVIREPGLAEDIVQESLIKAYRALPDFKGQSRLSTWLHRITYLSSIDCLRRERRHLRLAGEPAAGQQLADASPAARSDASVQGQQLRKQIELALGKLSPFEKTVFTLRHMQNFKLSEIATVVDRSEGTVKNILFRAIRKMREQLQDAHPILQELEQC